MTGAVVVGATSGIARALAAELAGEGRDLVLIARDGGEAERVAADLRLRTGRTVRALVCDITDTASHAGVVTQAAEMLGGTIGVVACCVGVMHPNAAARTDAALLQQTMQVNLTGPAHLVERFADRLEADGGGVIAVLSSVAGDRGRQSNYIYGAAKAGLTAFCSGLRNRLSRSGVHVVTVKPGFVLTAMTAAVLDGSSPLVASPERAARGILRAIRRRKNVAYVPWFWWGIMAIICSVPEFLFKRLRM